MISPVTILEKFEDLTEAHKNSLFTHINDWNNEPFDQQECDDFFKEEAHDMETLIAYIKDSGYSEETTDSNYIYNEYIITTPEFKFAVTGSSYRKDQSVCDEEMDGKVYITDLVAQKAAKAEEKAKKAVLDELKWKELFDAHTKEELFDLLKASKFPLK
jgi:hypothetical protein